MPIQINPERCTGCSYCVVACPTEAIHLDIAVAAVPRIDEQHCTRCGECLYVCPNNVFSDPTLEAQPVELEQIYDVLVIGAGIGGLMTAAGLARAGKKVLVLEQLSFVGGKYTQIPYRGYAISTAAWTCPGPNSRVGKLCTKLGADIQWITVHDVKSRGDHWVVNKDGRRFRSLDEAQEAIVGGPREMHRVHSWIADMYNPGVRYPDDMTPRQYIRKFLPDHPEYEKYVQTIITYCFASQTVDNFSAMETKRAIVDSIEQMADWGTAVGGTTAIVAALEKVIRQFNGTIALRTKVSSINVENGKAVGVTLQDGRSLHAKVVVHNAGLNRLIRLVGEEKLPQDFLARLKGAVPANVAALILGTSEPLLGDDHSLLHTMGWEPTLNCYAPTFFDPKLAPNGKHALDVFWVMEPPYDLHHELDRVLAQLREVFPGFDQKVDMQNPMFFSAPWTAEMAHRMGQSGKDRLDPQTPFQNLYMVGYDCIGYGMAGDIIPHGVERALYMILQDPDYLPADEKGSVRFNKWVKSQALKFMAWQGRMKAS
jgi:phytoene dehydrogenase-like protein/NAD-dependent dihydropyrimidine dehydrogenase PreA subunit